ncbi:MAG TPA: DUF4926 domain-containing protein [Candidatus Kapabacteria bacterium]|nr:DUF4926 domain-containing protein [Candidatus Kapabacteria bacterium]
MKFNLFQRVAFAVDLPDDGIRKGDVARIVEYFDRPRPGYALEVFNAVGETVAVVAVPESSLEPLTENERLQVRHVEA